MHTMPTMMAEDIGAAGVTGKTDRSIRSVTIALAVASIVLIRTDTISTTDTGITAADIMVTDITAMGMAATTMEVMAEVMAEATAAASDLDSGITTDGPGPMQGIVLSGP